MRHQNGVTPYGDIVAGSGRKDGKWMGNRGCLHEGDVLVRRWASKRWITCALAYKGWTAPKWDPGRWTALFFDDEAVAFAAGHRPCALCRRADYRRYLAVLGESKADVVDARLQADRLHHRKKRTHPVPWADVPNGAFVELEGRPAVVRGERLQFLSPAARYGGIADRPARGDATVLTPLLNIIALQAGYELAP